MERKVVIGRTYHYFKGGLYRVMGIATHTETNESLVIYQNLDGTGEVLACPYDTFVSHVDRKKYPNATQRYQFEEVSQGTSTNKKKRLKIKED